MKLNEVISFVMDFASFLFDRVPSSAGDIKSIVLFGSGARGELEKDSDIDLFVEVRKGKENPGDRLDELKEDFYRSDRYKGYWEVIYGSDYPLSIKSGDMEMWPELYPALIADGIVIYGSFNPLYEEGKKVLFSWECVRGKNRTNLYRNIFGYSYRGRDYAGLLNRYGGQKLGKGTILVPIEARDDFRKVFEKFEISFLEKVLIEV